MKSKKLPDLHFKLQLHASLFEWFLALQAGSSAWMEKMSVCSDLKGIREKMGRCVPFFHG